MGNMCNKELQTLIKNEEMQEMQEIKYTDKLTFENINDFDLKFLKNGKRIPNNNIEVYEVSIVKNNITIETFTWWDGWYYDSSATFEPLNLDDDYNSENDNMSEEETKCDN